MNSKCGVDCTKCELNGTCKGCAESNGHPFGGECLVAVCCQNNGYKHCDECSDCSCGLKEQIIAEFNALGIEDMEKVTDLYCLKGSFVNLEYTLPSGQALKFLDDNNIYLGNQISKKHSDRCYGLTADKTHLLVCEYGEGGTDAEIIIYKKRKI